ncbi:hypothetical protein ACN38_g6552 [Penicillium nordicum]|uniref:Secreted protein n=1 Tax=Penicillium nordicum TaxID=229535 RepID=A0A0M8P8G5_9EURO|nr:hypothetical protein ACN38_g6552 [Penicillium nordicum]
MRHEYLRILFFFAIMFFSLPRRCVVEAEKPNGTILFFSPRQSNLPPFFPPRAIDHFSLWLLAITCQHHSGLLKKKRKKKRTTDFKGNLNPVR